MTAHGKRIEKLVLELYSLLRQQEKEIFTKENFKMIGLKASEYNTQPALKNFMSVNSKMANAMEMAI
jgi:hypothetical protein